MRIWWVGVNTFRGLLRSRALLAFFFLVLFTVLSALGVFYFAEQLSEAGAAEQARLLFAQRIEGMLETFVLYGYFLAALAGAYLLPGEIKSGTIVPTLGRAVSRGQYLLGLFLGLNLLLATYAGLVAVMLGGLMVLGQVWPGPEMLLGVLYALLAVNIVLGLSFFFSTVFPPLVALAAMLTFLALPGLTDAVRLYSQEWADRLKSILTYPQPAWELLDYGNYFVLTRSAVERPWSSHLLGIAHGLDYLAVLLLLAYLVFRRRSLLPQN